MINLVFPVAGSSVPADHGYGLYSAISRELPSVHSPENIVQIAAIQGSRTEKGILLLNPRHSRLRLRLGAEEIAAVLPLTGKTLDVDGHRIQLGVPRVLPVVPAPALAARLVTIQTKDRATTAPAFLDAARRQLAQLGIQGEAGIPFVTAGPHTGQPRRLVVRVKGKRVIGYSLQVTGLTAEESIRLQEHGLGGKRKMGCGFFVPLVPRST
jgi:CRISPR-associated protein Cas6